jgi:hypothetical protein
MHGLIASVLAQAQVASLEVNSRGFNCDADVSTQRETHRNCL